MGRQRDLTRIEAALRASEELLEDFTPGAVAAESKGGAGPVTEADRRLDELLRGMLPEAGDGWLSEETVDDPARLDCERVWVVDPLDGTKEFVEGLPEWCVSIGLVENGRAVAGGIINPMAGHLMLGSLETGVTLDGEPARVSPRSELAGATVLASRSEVRRGEWDRFDRAGFSVEASGSVAYKLALVAVGMADATWTLVPKNEWDIAAGVALVEAAGGVCWRKGGGACRFNNPKTLYPGMIACGAALEVPIRAELGPEDAGA